ncbi:MAG: hypothetical protein SFH39_11230 [Candidatus Magnetobacterium sp. LHC-1]
MATVPTKFTIADSMSYEPGFGDSGWNSAYQMFNRTVLKGSYRAYNPIEGMGYCLNARRGYKKDNDGNLVSCYYRIRQSLLTPSNCYCYVGLLPTNRTKVRTYIEYKTEPFSDTYITSTLVGEDYESTGNVLKDGYVFGYFHVIALFDEGTALYRKVQQNMIQSKFSPRWLIVTGSFETTYFGIDGNTLQACYIYGARAGSFQHMGVVGDVEWTETLHIGSTDLTITRKEQSISCEGWFYASSFFPVTGSGGNCYGGMVNLIDVVQVCNGGVSGNGGVPVSFSASCDGIIIDDNSYGSVSGASNFQVYIFDSYQGESWYFIIYSFDEYSSSYRWNVNHYDTTYSFTRRYYMVYKTPSANLTQHIASWSNSVAGGTPNGTVILYPSVQINRGMIFWTYVVANADGNVYQYRVVGLHNESNKTYPTGLHGYTSSDIFGVDADLWQEKIAVGIST